MTLVYLNVEENYFNNFHYERFPAKTQYEIARFKSKLITAILYSSGKLVVQGSDAALEQFKKENQTLNLQFKKEKNQPSQVLFPESNEYIGSDETLKGDTFGGLVVVAAYFKKEEYSILKRLGVVDSKKLSDDKILGIAEILLNEYFDRFVIIELKPEEYNEIILTKSITQLLNDLHSRSGQKLKKKHPSAVHIVDQYPGCNCGDFMIQKAESYSLAVAAASIVARHVGLKQFERLSINAGFRIPKGSTHVINALEELNERKLSFKQFVKLHFKNVQKELKQDFL